MGGSIKLLIAGPKVLCTRPEAEACSLPQVPGLSAPIPPGAAFGFQPGGWGKAPVDENGEPLYGDVFAQRVEDEDELQVCTHCFCHVHRHG